jgi:hypothetical protein
MRSASRLVLIAAVAPLGLTLAATPTISAPQSLCMADKTPQTADATVAPGSITQLSWLSGVWVRSDGSDERWTPAASGSMLGVSRTLRKGILTEFEFLCIVQRFPDDTD